MKKHLSLILAFALFSISNQNLGHCSPSIAQLKETIYSSNTTQKDKRSAILQLARLETPQALNALIPIVEKNADPFLRKEAVSSLARFRDVFQGSSKKAGQILIQSINNDSDLDVRLEAIEEAGILDHDSVIPLLIKLTQDHNEKIRAESAYALGRLSDTHYQTHDLFTPLTNILQQEVSPLVIDKTYNALARLGTSGDKRVAKEFLRQLESEAHPHYKLAAKSLAIIGDISTLPTILNIIETSPNDEVRKSILTRLRPFKREKQVSISLAKLLKRNEQDENLHSYIFDALKVNLHRTWDLLNKEEKQEVLQSIAALLAHSDKIVREDAAILLNDYLEIAAKKSSDALNTIQCYFPKKIIEADLKKRDLSTGLRYTLDILFFGGVPVYLVGGAESPNNEVGKWPQEEIEQLNKLIVALINDNQ